MSSFALTGTVYSWAVAPSAPPRRYLQVCLPLSELDAMCFPTPFNAKTGEGEQRSAVIAHVRKLRREMAGGNYTPTVFTLGTHPEHRLQILYEGDSATLAVESSHVLPLLDGQQRLAALKQLLKERVDDGDEVGAEMIRGLRIPAIVLLDGCPKGDFVALQMGRAVDSTTLASLKLATGSVTGKNAPYVKLAFEVARHLNSVVASPFERLIKFDSRSLAAISVTTLVARGASDLSSSLLGLAKVEPDSWVAAKRVCQAVACLRELSPGLLEDGRFLTPPPDGTKGSATLLITVAIGLAHLCQVRQETEPSSRTLVDLAEAAGSVFDAEVDGNLSGPTKRLLAGAFFNDLFEAESCHKHDDLPTELVELLNASSLGVTPLPKKPKVKKNAKKIVKGPALPV